MSFQPPAMAANESMSGLGKVSPGIRRRRGRASSAFESPSWFLMAR
jgi:hypothetical protein